MKPIPGLNDLRVFEAAARLRNFRQAAEELNLTHGAVSHRMRALEEQLGVSLFERQHGMRLTEAGQQLYRSTEAALRLLQAGIEQIAQTQNGNTQRLRISALPSFTLHWLLPRLPDFRRQYPDIVVEIDTGVELVDLARDGFDIALRLGHGRWSGLFSEKLFDDFYYAAATPAFLREHGPVSLDSLGQLPLIHHAELKGGVTWTEFFHGKTSTLPALLNLTVFHESNVVLQAAEQGLGLALLRHSIAAAAVSSGRLVRQFDYALRGEYDYYFVCQPTHRSLQRIMQFHGWLRQQCQSFKAESAALRLPLQNEI